MFSRRGGAGQLSSGLCCCRSPGPISPASSIPLFVYGAGAVCGTVLPLLLWSVARLLRLKVAHLFRFFAGFCLVANGAYIGGDFSTVGPTDAGLLIEHGASRLALILFGLTGVAAGLFLWHGQSQHFFPSHSP